jgi:flagellum-specific peptidoglycan hydrolase FlgJ
VVISQIHYLIPLYTIHLADGGMPFSVYTDYTSATEDFILYLNYINMPQGLDCQGYNAYIVSRGYAVDPEYEVKLNAMCK